MHADGPLRARLAGKRVLITGTAGGQGKVAQELFAEEGARVFGCDLQESGAESTAAQLRARGLDVTGQQVDLADAAEAASWVDSAAAALGGIDVLYNNASGYGFAPFAEMTLELWRHVMSVELDIIFHTTQPAWKHLVASRNASIINTASTAGIRGLASAGQVAHAAAKSGVIGMSRSLALEGAPDGVRVNAISPGFIETPATDAAIRPEMRSYIVGLHPLGRAGQPMDIAQAALYLASDESSWVTGQNFCIDGGFSAGFN